MTLQTINTKDKLKAYLYYTSGNFVKHRSKGHTCLPNWAMLIYDYVAYSSNAYIKPYFCMDHLFR